MRALARPDAAARIADGVGAGGNRCDRCDECAGRASAGGHRCTARRVRQVLNVLGKTRRMHFVGIGGIGMSGIAELLANLGYG